MAGIVINFFNTFFLPKKNHFLKDSKQFCKCLGGELVEILDNGLMNSLSFYTLGLNDGLKKIETG